jgi:hypothetical protein
MWDEWQIHHGNGGVTASCGGGKDGAVSGKMGLNKPKRGRAIEAWRKTTRCDDANVNTVMKQDCAIANRPCAACQ